MPSEPDHTKTIIFLEAIVALSLAFATGFIFFVVPPERFFQ